MLIVTFPCKLPSVANLREHWRAKAVRTKRQRSDAHWYLRTQAPSWFTPCTVTLTRISPRPLDGDNLQSAFKAIRDGVADFLGVDDRDPSVTWAYAQRRGEPKQCAVEVRIE